MLHAVRQGLTDTSLVHHLSPNNFQTYYIVPGRQEYFVCRNQGFWSECRFENMKTVSDPCIYTLFLLGESAVTVGCSRRHIHALPAMSGNKRGSFSQRNCKVLSIAPAPTIRIQVYSEGVVTATQWQNQLLFIASMKCQQLQDVALEPRPPKSGHEAKGRW